MIPTYCVSYYVQCTCGSSSYNNEILQNYPWFDNLIKSLTGPTLSWLSTSLCCVSWEPDRADSDETGLGFSTPGSLGYWSHGLKILLPLAEPSSNCGGGSCSCTRWLRLESELYRNECCMTTCCCSGCWWAGNCGCWCKSSRLRKCCCCDS